MEKRACHEIFFFIDSMVKGLVFEVNISLCRPWIMG